MKQVVLGVTMLLLFCGMSFADENSTIVGPVMENRYVAPSPDENVPVSETTQKLMDKGVIPAAEEARLEQQVLQKKK